MWLVAKTGTLINLERFARVRVLSEGDAWAVVAQGPARGDAAYFITRNETKQEDAREILAKIVGSIGSGATVVDLLADQAFKPKD
jgi:hypothetical protein